MRDKRDVMRLHIQNGIRDLDGIRESYNSFGGGGFTQRTDAIQSYAPRNRFESIPISQEQQFNLKHFGQFNRPQQRQQIIQQPTNVKESQESKRLAEKKIKTREGLQRFEEQQRIDKERELKVAPYAVMGLVGTATGTLPAMIAGEVGGRTVDYGSKKLTGKSWGENVLPEAPMIGELTNPGYIVGGLAGQYRNEIGSFAKNEISEYARPYLIGDKSIPMSRYKPKTNFINDVIGDGFKSEIDWGNWNKEIPENKALIQEYNSIEQAAKTKGTWMKNPDGTAFNGTPEQFVQQNSSNFKKAFPDYYGKILNHNSNNKFNQFSRDYFGTASDNGWYGEGVYMHPSKEYTKPYGDINYELYVNSGNKGFITKDNYDISSKYSRDYAENMKQLKKKRNSYIDEIHGDRETYSDQDFFKKQVEKRYASERKKMIQDYIEAKKSGINKYTTLENPLNGEIVVPFKNYPKSAIGNNGMFDMTNPNIYKSLIPTVGIGYGLTKQQ